MSVGQTPQGGEIVKPVRWIVIALLVALLSPGCAGEATTAAKTAAEIRKREVEQGKKDLEAAQKKIDAAAKKLQENAQGKEDGTAEK